MQEAHRPDRVYLQGAIGRNSGVIALNRTDGKVVWAKVVGPAQGNDKGGGPRSTPTVDGDRVYVLTESDDRVLRLDWLRQRSERTRPGLLPVRNRSSPGEIELM